MASCGSQSASAAAPSVYLPIKIGAAVCAIVRYEHPREIVYSLMKFSNVISKVYLPPPHPVATPLLVANQSDCNGGRPLNNS